MAPSDSSSRRSSGTDDTARPSRAAERRGAWLTGTAPGILVLTLAAAVLVAGLYALGTAIGIDLFPSRSGSSSTDPGDFDWATCGLYAGIAALVVLASLLVDRIRRR
jgi:hypothetical protein